MSYIDIHSHYNLESFDTDREDAIKKLIDKKGKTIVVGVDEQSSLLAVELSKTYQGTLFACVGFHPDYVTDSLYDETSFRSILETENVVCIGECGLDYFRLQAEDYVTRDLQKEVFRSQIALAAEFDLPLMLHIRPTKGTYDAYDDVLAILKQESITFGSRLRGNAHFFLGTQSHAEAFFALGFTVSFTGVITFVKEYESLVLALPLESIMAETDAPFVAPVPYRGRRCEPWMVEEVYKKIADIKKLPVEQVKDQIIKNVHRMFRI